MKVFLDANVVFSAASDGSGIAKLVDALCEHHEVISCAYARAEARRNIFAKRPGWHARLELLATRIPCVPDHVAEVGVTLAVKDRPILASALHEHCDFLVTGDRRDFGHLFGQEVGGVRIVSPPMMADWLVSGETGRSQGHR